MTILQRRNQKSRGLLRLCEEENWTCYLCGGKVEDIRHASRDHVVPRALGGRKVRLAHLWCNNEKGDRLLGDNDARARQRVVEERNAAKAPPPVTIGDIVRGKEALE